MSLMKAGSGSAEYLLQYAEEGGERMGEWMGSGAEALGLKGVIEPQAFRNLFAGLSPDGIRPIVSLASIRKDFERAPGWDKTLSVPKDASIVAGLIPAARSAVEKSLINAARDTIEAIEQNFAFVRRGSGGKRLEPCKLVIAAFMHNTSRNNDPQWHIHLLILNVAKHSNGFGTIVSKALYDNQRAIDRIFKAAFATALQRELKLEIQSVTPKPFEFGEAFNIRGVPDELRKLLSSRRAEILTEMAKRGITTERGSEAAALQTRRKKTHHPMRVLEDEWSKAARSIGVDILQMTRAIFQPTLDTAQTLPKVDVSSTAAEKSTPIFNPPANNDVEARHTRALASTLQTLQEPPKRLEPSQTVNATQAAATTPSEIFKSLFRNAAAGIEITSTIDRLIDTALEMADRKQSSRLRVNVGARPGEAAEALSSALSVADELRQTNKHVVAADQIKNGLFGRLTSREADSALVTTLSRTGSIACVDARHGVDANLFVGALAEQYGKAGFTVKAFTATSTAASELETIIGKAVHTTGQLLIRLKTTPAEVLKHHLTQLYRAAIDAPALERWQFDPKTVVVITQSQALKTTQLDCILSEARAAGAKVVLVGSTDQLVRSEPHNAFSEIVGRVGKVTLPISAAPAHDWMAEAARQVSRGDTRGALSHFVHAEKLHLAKDQRSAAVELASYYRALPKHEQNGKTMMVAATPREARVLNALAHEHRRVDGKLGMLMRQKIDGSWVRRGDRIFFHGSSKHFGFRAGDLGTIEKIGLDGVRIRLDRTARALLVNRTVGVDVPKNLYKLLSLGYAITANDAQGMTFEKALVLPKAGGTDTRSLLVQLSRAREETRVFTTARSIGEDVEAIAETEKHARLKTTETIKQAVSAARHDQTAQVSETTTASRHKQRISQ